MVGLGDLAGGLFGSGVTDVSADGSVLVGHAQTASGTEAFIWDAANGMRNLKDVLVAAGLGADLTGWTLNYALGVSGDGLTIVGWGINPSGNDEAWMAKLGPTTVTIDIKPGSDPNSINLCSRGVVPVAIFGSDDVNVKDIVVNVEEVVVQNLELAGSGIAIRGRSKLLYSVEDLNGDGKDDMIVHFDVEDLDPTLIDGEAIIRGELMDGTLIQGSDSVNIVRDECP
jgi:probable HAF family extracellular repeat protein